MKDVLTILKEARALIERKHVQQALTDGNGGFCALGAINQATTGDAISCEFPHADIPLYEASNRLYPEYGRYGAHGSSVLYVNNVLGKQATLEMFDDAILHEELRLLCEKVNLVEAEHAEPVTAVVEVVSAR